jgi:hypothetical protein
LKQLKSWASTRVVNAMVRASSMPPDPPNTPPARRRSSATSVTTAMTTPTQIAFGTVARPKSQALTVLCGLVPVADRSRLWL